MSLSDRQNIGDLLDQIHRLRSEVAGIPVRDAGHGTIGGDYGTVKGFVRVAATSVDTAVQLWDLELLHRPAPPGVQLGERTDAGTFAVRNIFNQDYEVGDIVVAFETIGSQTSPTESPGLANQNAQDLANQSAGELAGLTDYTRYRLEETLWWGFKPGGVGVGVGYFELIEPLTLGGNAARANVVNLDGSVGTTTVWLIDDPTEASRFEGLAPYTDQDDNAATHNGYRYFGIFATDDYNSTGQPGYRIIDGEAPLQRIVVTLADGDTISGTGGIKVKESPTDREGYPDNGRFPRLKGQESPGAGGGSFFYASDVYSLFQDDADANTKYIVRWSAHHGTYIFDEKLEADEEEEHGLFKTNATIMKAAEAAGEIVMGVGTAQQWLPKAGGPIGTYTLQGPSTIDLYNYATNEDVAANTNVMCKKIDGLWFIDWEQCPTSP